MNIILCGMPKCGKSTVAKALSIALGKDFIDTDLLIENAYREKTNEYSSCRQITLEKGDAYFRNLEKEQIFSLDNIKNSVIALGGGSFTNPQCIPFIQSLGLLVYLQCTIQTLYARIDQKNLPSYLDKNTPMQSFEKLFSERTPSFLQAAQTTIDTSCMTVDEIVLKIRAFNGK